MSVLKGSLTKKDQDGRTRYTANMTESRKYAKERKKHSRNNLRTWLKDLIKKLKKKDLSMKKSSKNSSELMLLKSKQWKKKKRLQESSGWNNTR